MPNLVFGASGTAWLACGAPVDHGAVAVKDKRRRRGAAVGRHAGRLPLEGGRTQLQVVARRRRPRSARVQLQLRERPAGVEDDGWLRRREQHDRRVTGGHALPPKCLRAGPRREQRRFSAQPSRTRTRVSQPLFCASSSRAGASCLVFYREDAARPHTPANARIRPHSSPLRLAVLHQDDVVAELCFHRLLRHLSRAPRRFVSCRDAAVQRGRHAPSPWGA